MCYEQPPCTPTSTPDRATRPKLRSPSGVVSKRRVNPSMPIHEAETAPKTSTYRSARAALASPQERGAGGVAEGEQQRDQHA
eukprot:961706-Pyramimonas_sp.AAC.1